MSEDQYTVQQGDTLRSIAAKVYGDPELYTFIQTANGQYVDPEVGSVLVIPSIAERRGLSVRTSLPGKAKDDLTILIGGIEIVPESARIFRAIDNCADGWTAVISWTPGANVALDKLLLPFKYPEAAVYIGGELVISGAVYGVRPFKGDRREKVLEGFSFAADAIDSVVRPPYQWWNSTLEQHAKELLVPIGISAVFDFPSERTFDTIDAEPSTKIFDHLYTLAFQCGLLITSSPTGDLVFTRAKQGPSVGTLSEGKPGVLDWEGSFDGRKRYNSYRAYGYSPLAGDKAVVTKDEFIPRSRELSFSVDDAYTWDIGYAAEWKRSKQVADSISIQLPVTGWHAPDGSLWNHNTLVTVVSETLMVPEGFTFLIRSVEFALDKKDRKTLLNIVPPGVYAKRGERTVDPWT